jgi:protein TonB
VRAIDVADLSPPPPPPDEEQREEEPPPEPPPELVEEAPPLDLQQLELALNPGFGDAMFGDVGVKLTSHVAAATGEEDEIDRIFSMADLDQRPRVLFQAMPSYPPELRRSKRQGTVYIVFLVDKLGRVTSPRVEKTTDPAFERPALEAVTQWKFEPGVRNGEKVQFKMRVPISFNAG